MLSSKNKRLPVWSSFRRYNVQWYIAPLRIQKLILFLLQRGTKAFEHLVVIGGLFVGSLEGFATVKILSEFTQCSIFLKHLKEIFLIAVGQRVSFILYISLFHETITYSIN